jgi:hypothetical protein
MPTGSYSARARPRQAGPPTGSRIGWDKRPLGPLRGPENAPKLAGNSPGYGENYP